MNPPSAAPLAVASRNTWEIDTAHTAAEFSVRHLMITTVKGRFPAVTGAIVLDEHDLRDSVVEVTINAASIDTRNDQRDAHLRSADFFDAEKFPLITFHSTRVEPLEEGHLRVTGDLTIHGHTRPVVLDVTSEGRIIDPWGGERVGFSATTKIDRRDFGLTWNVAIEGGGITVGHDVKIALEVEAIRKVA
jgi:polyisoprenoid-binding protein YceI